MNIKPLHELSKEDQLLKMKQKVETKKRQIAALESKIARYESGRCSGGGIPTAKSVKMRASDAEKIAKIRLDD